jgi:predicted phage-related endonuclease
VLAVNAPLDIKALGDPDHDFRSTHVGASECAALFDCSPYVTRFELWHRRKGNIASPDLSDNERAEWGLRLEPAIIAAASDRYGYQLEETPRRLSNGRGLGGHPDQLASDERGPGIIEIKTADWLVFKHWGDEPPEHYLLQAMAYAGLAGRKWCDIIVLVGGNRLERFCYDFRPKIYGEIERRVEAFWQSVEANDPPPADYARDLDTITDLYREGTEEVVDLTADNLAHEAAAAFLFAKETRLEAEKREDAAKAELLDKLGAASAAKLNGFSVRATTVDAIPERAAEPGEIIKGRKSYRRITVKELT